MFNKSLKIIVLDTYLYETSKQVLIAEEGQFREQ